MIKQTGISAIVLTVALIASGCASQSAFDSLQKDVDNLSEQVAQAKSESAEALRISQGLQMSLDEVKQSADSARDDASATRTMLEQMNARLDKQFGAQSLK